jgi:hypothetical protein
MHGWTLSPSEHGKGAIDFPAVVDALADIGFSQWAQLETSSPSSSLEQDLARNLAPIPGGHRAPAGGLVLRHSQPDQHLPRRAPAPCLHERVPRVSRSAMPILLLQKPEAVRSRNELKNEGP